MSAVVASIPLPEGVPLHAASLEQTPLVVQQVVVQLLAVLGQQAERIKALDHLQPIRAVMLDRGQVVASSLHADLVAAGGPYAQLIATQRRHTRSAELEGR